MFKLFGYPMPEMSIGLDLDWTGSGLWQILLNLDWIRMAKFFTILEQNRIWTHLMDKNCVFWSLKSCILLNFWILF